MTAPTLRVLFAGDPWFDVPGAQRMAGDAAELILDRSMFPVADAVVFPLPTAPTLPRQRAFPEQVWVLWCQESETHFPALTDHDFLAAFDVRATYRLDSDVPIPYCAPTTFDDLPPLVALDDRHPTPVSAWVSSAWDRCGRDDYLRQMMEHVPVHSYGRVAHNTDLAEDLGPLTKKTTISRYRFTVAFENSIAPGYVTEKLFQPLRAGSVPIYRGAPDVDRYLPAGRCMINADDFGSPHELAEFLLQMIDAEYASYHEWRGQGTSTAYRDRFAAYADHAMVRLARAITVARLGRAAEARNAWRAG